MILHLFKNDVRYLRGWLFAWVGLLGLMVLMMCGLRTSLGWNIGYWDFLRYGVLLGFLVQVLFQSLLMIKCVQKENLQTVKSYWLTRPIGRGHLVVAKLLFWLLLILLPQVVQCALIGAVFPGGWSGALHGLAGIVFVVSLLGFFSILAGGATKDVGQAFVVVLVVPFALVLLGHLLVKGLGRFLYVEHRLYSLTAIPYLETGLIVVGLVFELFVYWQQMYHPSRRRYHRLAYVGVLVLFFSLVNYQALSQCPRLR